MARGKKKRRIAPPATEEAGQASAPEGQTAPQETPVQRSGRFPHIPKPESKAGSLIELVVIVALALGLALAIQAWLVKPYQIPSGSMEPTLDIGQRILVNRFVYHFEDPQVGDIVVFHPPAGSEGGPGEQCGIKRNQMEPCPTATDQQAGDNFIKRIVAGPGDTLSVREGHPVVNGKMVSDEPYINPCPSCNLPEEITVPPDHYFMMGDNRGASDDSREWGPVPKSWIIGEAFATYWPPDRIGLF